MGTQARGPEVRPTEDRACPGLVHEWVIEQTEDELLPEEAANRLIDSGFRNPPGLDETDEAVRAVLATDLVDTGFDQLQQPLVGIEVSTPHARAALRGPGSGASMTRPQSVQTMPSKPSFSRKRPVITERLKLKPTSSYSVPTGMP